MNNITLRSIAFQVVQHILINNVLAIKVFDTTSDADLFRGSEIGISLKTKYPNNSVNDTTVCFTFFNYKILDHQYLFTFGSFFIGTSFSRDNSLFHYDSDTFYWPENDDIITILYTEVLDVERGFKIISYEIAEWPMNDWNDFCFSLSIAQRRFRLMMNGKMLLMMHIWSWVD